MLFKVRFYRPIVEAEMLSYDFVIMTSRNRFIQTLADLLQEVKIMIYKTF